MNKNKEKMNLENFRYFLDGDHLCVVRNDFVNLVESPALFIKLSKKEIEMLDKIEEKYRNKLKEVIEELESPDMVKDPDTSQFLANDLKKWLKDQNQ